MDMARAKASRDGLFTARERVEHRWTLPAGVEPFLRVTEQSAPSVVLWVMEKRHGSVFPVTVEDAAVLGRMLLDFADASGAKSTPQPVQTEHPYSIRLSDTAALYLRGEGTTAPTVYLHETQGGRLAVSPVESSRLNDLVEWCHTALDVVGRAQDERPDHAHGCVCAYCAEPAVLGVEDE